MSTFNSKQLATQITEHEDCNFKDIREVADSIFGFVASTIKSGDRENYEYKNIRIQNFGIFGVKKGRIDYYKKKDQENG